MTPTARGTLLGAAAGIAVVTVLARVAGLGRTVVLAGTVGPSDVGDTYTAVNALPNVVFEVVAGGALAAVVVPLVAAALVVGDREQVDRTASALLTWTLAVLVPVALLGLLAAPLLVRALLGDEGTGAGSQEVGTRMLRVFLPQVPLYGVAVVLGGLLQAHRRFLGPALAPLVSSLVVVVAYLAYATTGAVASPADLTRGQELVLSVGTTLGVAALALTVLVPLRGTGLRLRPTLSFPPGVAARARSLTASGVAVLVAQQVSLLVALRLAVGGPQGSVVVLTVATAAFLSAWAVLAVPVATSAFPRLAEAAATDDRPSYDAVLGASLRSVLALSAAGTLLLVVLAGPLAGLLLRGAPGLDDPAVLADGVRAFAPGLVGYGLSAVLARALLARGRAADSATGQALGWLAAAGCAVVLVAATDLDRVVAVGLGSSTGLTLGAVVLGAAVLRGRRG